MLVGLWGPKGAPIEKSLRVASQIATGTVVDVDVDKQFSDSGFTERDRTSWKERFSEHVGQAPKLLPDTPYEPAKDSGHLQLGLPLEGMWQVSQKIGFIRRECQKKAGSECSEWVYTADYQRAHCNSRSRLNEEVG